MTGERIYAALLRLYPQSFREEYGADMAAAFRQLRHAHSGTPLAFWSFVLVDLARSATRSRLDEWRQGRHRIALRFMASSAIGMGATIAVAQGTVWTYRYFYHPYFEGVSIPVLPYGLGLGLVLGVSVALAQCLLLPARVRRASRWALASAVALPIAVLFCGAALDRALAGLNPLVVEHQPLALDVFVVALGRTTTWTEIALQSSAMAVSAFAVRFLLRKPLMERRHAH
jgi:hypothetical protein